MSAVEFSEVHRLSREEFHEMVRSGALEDVRVELIDGLLCDMSPPSPEHEFMASWLTRLLAERLDRSYHLRVASPLTIGSSEPQPDLAVIKPGTPAPYHPASAELVIEVCISSRRRDLVVKPRIYSAAGVKDYWVIDVENARVVVHQRPMEDRYELRFEFGPEHSLDGSVVGITPIPVADVLAAAQPPR